MRYLIFILILTTPLNSHGQTWGQLMDLCQESTSKGDFQRALIYAKQALQKTQNAGNTDHYALALSHLAVGTSYMMLGEYHNAGIYMHKGLNISESFFGKDHESQVNHLSMIGLLYMYSGRYEECESILQRGLKIIEKTGGPKPRDIDYATILNTLASVYQLTGRFDESEETFNLSLEYTRASNGRNSNDYARVLNNKAVLLSSMGRNREAETLYKESVEIAGQLSGQDNYFYAHNLANLGKFYSDIGRLYEAEVNIKKSLELKEKILGTNHPEVTMVYNNLGVVYLNREKYDKAEPLFKKARALSTLNFGRESQQYLTSQNNLANVSIYRKKYIEAEKALKDVLALHEKLFNDLHPTYSTTLGNLAAVYAYMGNISQAYKYYSLKNNVIHKKLSTLLPGMNERSRSILYMKIAEEFEVFNTHAVKELKSIPAALGDMYNNRIILKGLLLQQIDKTKKSILSSGDAELVNLYRKWIINKERIANAYINNHGNEAIAKLESITNQLEQQLSFKSRVFGKTNIKNVTWLDIRSRLGKKEAAMEIIRFTPWEEDRSKDINKVDDKIYYAALIIKSFSRFPELVLFKNGVDLEGKFKLSFDSCRRTTKTRAYQHYWLPISRKLEGIEKVYVSTDGIFNQINLNILPNPHTGKHLIDEIDLQLVANTKDIIPEPSHSVNTRNHAEVFGRPEYSAANVSQSGKTQDNISSGLQKMDFPDLPGTESELKKIEKILKDNDWSVNIHLREKANEERAKSVQGAKLLHFATHGFFLPDVMNQPTKSRLRIKGHMEVVGHTVNSDPLFRSGIVLSGNSNFGGIKNDGFLTSYEIINLNLEGTELVVLSGCNTGLGVLKKSEGIYGLQRAFKVAGAENLIMSLWPVNDFVTQYFMTAFYKEWLLTSNKHQAFKNAQLQTRKSYHEPYQWGAFILI